MTSASDLCDCLADTRAAVFLQELMQCPQADLFVCGTQLVDLFLQSIDLLRLFGLVFGVIFWMR